MIAADLSVDPSTSLDALILNLDHHLTLALPSIQVMRRLMLGHKYPPQCTMTYTQLYVADIREGRTGSNDAPKIHHPGNVDRKVSSGNAAGRTTGKRGANRTSIRW